MPALAQQPVAQSPTVRMHHDARHVYHRDSGFWPADVAAGVVGGAVGTAAAIATAPFPRYAYYDAPARSWNYGDGFVCRPGTTFIGADGLRHLCQ